MDIISDPEGMHFTDLNPYHPNVLEFMKYK